MVKSLYFHIPYCSKKCPYCHFYVIPKQKSETFLTSLLTEWEMRRPEIEGEEIASIYFGGGTPTLFPEGIEAILSRVTAPEITVEGNPEDITPELVGRLKRLGVNRMSLGMQSLDNILLKYLGRNHTASDSIEAIETIKGGGINNISIDLMYELPHQTIKSWEETVNRAASLPITHLSLYNLTFEPHTSFHKREKELRPHLPSEEICAKMLQMACDHFELSGLKRYEISAFARDEMTSVHNTGYWTYRNFLGFGPSAFSYIDGRRFRNVSHIGKYQRALAKGTFPIDFEEALPFPASLHERIAIGLRLFKGIELKNLPKLTEALMEKLKGEGWIDWNMGQATLTKRGRLFYDTVAEKIIL